MKIYSTLKLLFSWPLGIVGIVFLVYALYQQHIQPSVILENLNPFFVFISVVCFFSYYLLRSFVWQLILQEKKISIPIEKSVYMWGISELKRFIPGNFWAFLGRGVLLSAEGVGKKEIFHLLVIEIEFFLIGCLVLSGCAVPFLVKNLSISALYSPFLSFFSIGLPLIAAGIFLSHKSMSSYSSGWVKKIWKILPGFEFNAMFYIQFLTVVSLLLFGVGSYFAVLSITFLTPLEFLSFVLFFVFSLFFGYITIITPMGLGVREGIISVGLTPFIGPGNAIVVALFTRILQIIGEAVFLTISVLWLKNKKLQKFFSKIEKNRVEVLLGIVIVTFFLYFTASGFLRYENFFTGRFDLGNMDQTVWNTAHGRIFELTDPNGTQITSRLAFHADFILILLSPFYFIWSDPRTLILIQSAAVAGGAIFVYLISKHILSKKTISFIISLAYLLNPSLSYSLLYDFHPVVLATGFLLASYYFLIKKKYALFFLCTILAALTKEEVWIIAAFLGVKMACDNLAISSEKIEVKNKILVGVGGAMFFACLAVFYLLVSHIIPSLRGDVHFALSYFSHLGSSPLEIVLSLFTSPQKWIQLVFAPERLSYLMSVFAPVAFLPIFSIPTLLFATPDFAINLLSNNGQLHEIYYQYTATVTPFIFIATIYAVRFLKNKLPYVTHTRVGVLLIASSLISARILGPLPGSARPNIDMYIKQIPKRHEISEFLETIDKDVSVAASNNVGSHLSQRKKIYTIPNGLKDADVVVFLLNDIYAQPSLASQKQMVKELKKNRSYSVLYEDGDFIAFLRLKSGIISK